jgi:hypothetical protein
MLEFSFDVLLFFSRQLHLVHLTHERVPGFLLIDIFFLLLCVLAFDISLNSFCSLTCRISGLVSWLLLRRRLSSLASSRGCYLLRSAPTKIVIIKSVYLLLSLSSVISGRCILSLLSCLICICCLWSDLFNLLFL